MTDDYAQTRTHLEQIPDLFANLGLFLVRGPSAEGTFGAPSGSRPPMDLGVIDLLDEREKRDCEPTRTADEIARDRLNGARRMGVLPILVQWTRLVDSELWDEGIEHAPLADSPTVASECGFLLLHLAWCAEQQWFNELADDVRKIRGDLRQATRSRDVEDLRLACTQCGWPNIERMADGAWFRCAGCGESWGRLEMHKMAERKRPRPLKQVAEFVNAPHRTLRHLVAEGKLKHVARDGNANLYDIQDAVVALAWVKIRSESTPA